MNEVKRAQPLKSRDRAFAVCGKRHTNIATAYDRGYRTGRIEARAELTALWRARVADVLTILQAPIPPAQKDKA